jgi:hypothetical protein
LSLFTFSRGCEVVFFEADDGEKTRFDSAYRRKTDHVDRGKVSFDEQISFVVFVVVVGVKKVKMENAR